ncbi:MAG: MotA/TolQ/ExbB proton channel family protein [Roseibacillus sp.]
MNRLLLSVPALLATTGAALGADESADPTKVNVLEILKEGGIMMWPLALLSISTVVLIILFFITIRRSTVVSDRFMRVAESLIRKRDYLGLVGYAHRRGECIARITQKTMDFATKNSDAQFNEIREVAEAEGSRQASTLNQRISYLADIGVIAPMIGLLGTVLGMIRAFLEINTGNVEVVRQMKLAGGVAEALVTTASGLTIGIIAMIFYSVFRGRVQRSLSELEAAATHLLALLGSQYQRTGRYQQPAEQILPPDGQEDYAVPRSQMPAPSRTDQADAI